MRPHFTTRLRRAVPGGLVAAVLGAGAAGLLACGDTNGLIASDTASKLQDRLDGISTAVDGHHCSTARSGVARFRAEIAGLPPTVNPRLRARLDQGARSLAATAANDCRKPQPKTTPTPTPTTPTYTAPPTPTPTQTTPTPTPTQTTPTPTQTTPTPTTPKPKPKPDNGGKGKDKGGGPPGSNPSPSNPTGSDQGVTQGDGGASG